MTAAPAALYARDRVIAGVEKLRFFPLAVQTGQGCWLTEPGGRRLLDLSATWSAVALGHGHPAVASAVAAALANPPGAGTLSTVHPDSIGLAEDLLALVPGDGERRVYSDTPAATPTMSRSAALGMPPASRRCSHSSRATTAGSA